MKKKKTPNTLTFFEQLELKKKEVKQLENLILLHKYFSKCSSIQNSYIVEMRKIKASELSKLGYSLSDIGRVFNRKHSTIIHLLNKESIDSIHQEVKENIENWINEKKYPIIYRAEEKSILHKTGWKSVIKYKLVDEDLISRSREGSLFKEKKISKYKGIIWSVQLQEWKAVLRIDGEVFNLGYFEKEEDAIISINLKREEWKNGYL